MNYNGETVPREHFLTGDTIQENIFLTGDTIPREHFLTGDSIPRKQFRFSFSTFVSGAATSSGMSVAKALSMIRLVAQRTASRSMSSCTAEVRRQSISLSHK